VSRESKERRSDNKTKRAGRKKNRQELNGEGGAIKERGEGEREAATLH